MRKLTKSTLFTLVMGIFLFSACKKGDDGAAGPEGPAGPAGPNGGAGAKGDPGTANVIYSDWLDVSYKPDTIMVGAVITDTVGYFASIAAAKLDKTMLTQGEIKVYFNIGSAADPIVWPLPYFDVYNGININPTFSVGFIDLYTNAGIAGTISDAGVKYQQYRYILIPGGAAARKADDINWNNYSEVKAYLGLKD